MPTKFKDGDRVRVASNHPEKGREGVIATLYGSLDVVVEFRDRGAAVEYIPFDEADLELVPQPSAFAMAAASHVQFYTSLGGLRKEVYKEAVANAAKACAHSWVEYVGFTNRFEYCSKCDVRKAAI